MLNEALTIMGAGIMILGAVVVVVGLTIDFAISANYKIKKLLHRG